MRPFLSFKYVFSINLLRRKRLFLLTSFPCFDKEPFVSFLLQFRSFQNCYLFVALNQPLYFILFLLFYVRMASESWIEEIAREELKKLENQHPNRFNHLKTELKLFISEPKFEPSFLFPEPISPCPTHYASTQVSSNRKRNLDCGTMHNKEIKKKRTRKEVRCMHYRTKDKVESAIERAEACLERIREVKKSLMPPWLVNQLRA